MTRKILIAQNRTTGDYEVIIWRDNKALVVQTNIRTRLNAEAVRKYWHDLLEENSDAT